MVDGEVFGRYACPLHPHCRQGVANRHGYRRAGGGSQVQRANLPIHRAIQHHVAPLSQAGLQAPHQGDQGRAAAAQVGQDRQQLFGFTAVGEQQGDVVGSHDAEIAVQGIDRIEKYGRKADGGKGGSDFAGNDAALAHTRKYELGAALAAPLQQFQSGLHLVAAEALGGGGNGSSLFLQAAGKGRQDAGLADKPLSLAGRRASV